MKPVVFSFASQKGSKTGIASVPSTEGIRLKGSTHVLLSRKEKKTQIGEKTNLVASDLVATSTQAVFAPHVTQESHASIISMEDQQVRAGLLIAMELAKYGPKSEAEVLIEGTDKAFEISEYCTQKEVEAKAPKTRRNSKKQEAKVEPVPLEMLKFLTFSQTALRYQVHTEKALRHLQAQAEAYLRLPKAGLRSNGFNECIFRPAGQRKILIVAAAYEQWLVAYSMNQRQICSLNGTKGKS